MKKIISLATIICFTLITNAQKNFEIDMAKSVVKWTGSNLFKYNKHYGTVKFKKGHVTKSNDFIISPFLKSNDVILGGYFEIDMNSIANTDGKYNDMLVGHLKNQDFFDVEKYPLATIKFTNVVHKNVDVIRVKAELTIKNITNEITFDMKYKVLDGRYQMHSKFIIDRTKWGIKYESKDLFSGVKDDIISDTIEFEVTIECFNADKC
ncbi:YceI family protein [Flavivirga algicola]|uniref:YceI family protein n=1 Tax=Flavivirga algicola TaxID=2729136 RepID=A0ABX1S3W2_9FLAO|nr:YceI family protein [Flavivirga algicola]NMH89215.1 YceI family protein [Flavivirga algicola]